MLRTATDYLGLLFAMELQEAINKEHGEDKEIIHGKCGKRIEDCTCEDAPVKVHKRDENGKAISFIVD